MTAREIVAAALEINLAERAAYMRRACGDDQHLLHEAEDLLNASLEAKPSRESPDRTATIASDLYESATCNAVIGPYRLVRQLGEGGMGVVYHARQLQPIRRDVALKIIKPGMDSKQVIARFESERQALAMMDHANIARVFDAGATSTGRPFFVMELVDGIPITRYCDLNRLTLNQRIELFLPVCHAIQHAHQKGIIHRDIKPSNLLVAEQDGRPVPKVIDFGLAKALGHQLSDASMMTNLGTVVGTLEYMSPEQADLAKHDIDTRSDVYSLGVVLYELLTGTTPLEHERLAKAGYVETLQRIRDEEPAPPSARLRQSTTAAEVAGRRRTDPARLQKLLHGELDWIATKALEKDRTRRYETVNGLARDLQRYLEGEPVEAGRPSTAYRLRKFARKHRLWLSAAAAFTALLVAGVVVSSWMALRASRAEAEARAVNDFLQKDLLAQASTYAQASANTKPDPNLTVRTALDRAAAKIAGRFERQPLVEASIQQTIGDAYTDLGLYPNAQGHLERAMELRNRALGGEHPDTLVSTNRLARAYERQGKYAQAEPLYARVLDTQRRVLGEEHPETLASLSGLAVVHIYQGKYAQGEPLMTKLLEVQRRVFGEGDPRTLNSMNNLAVVYQLQGKYIQSEALLVKLLEIQQRVLGEEHPNTLRTIVNLAEVYGNQGKYTQAEPLYLKGLDSERRVLGEEHSSTLYCMNSLAELYENQGKYSPAEALFAQVLDIRRRVFGEENPFTLTSMNGLADVYQRQGNYRRAEALFTRVLALRRRVLGDEHPDTLSTLASLGGVRLQQQNYAESEAMFREALRSNEKTRAEAWQRFYCLNLLGASLAGQRKYVEAEPLLVSGYEGLLQRESTMSTSDRSVLGESGERIVELYQGWGKPEKAAEWRQKLQITRSVARPQ